MKTLIVTLVLSILVMSCKKQNITNKQTTTASVNIVHEDYTVPFFLRDKLHYYKDLNTVFINTAKSKGKGC